MVVQKSPPTQYWIVCAVPRMYLENPDTYTHISVYIYIYQIYTHVYAYAAYVYVRGISCMRMNHEVLRFPLIIVLRDCRPLSFLAFSTLFCPGNDGTARISFERPGVAVLATFELPSTWSKPASIWVIGRGVIPRSHVDVSECNAWLSWCFAKNPPFWTGLLPNQGWQDPLWRLVTWWPPIPKVKIGMFHGHSRFDFPRHPWPGFVSADPCLRRS